MYKKNHLLVLTAQAPPAVVTESQIKHHLMPSRHRARRESARPLTDRGVGAGTSVQAAVIFDE